MRAVGTDMQRTILTAGLALALFAAGCTTAPAQPAATATAKPAAVAAVPATAPPTAAPAPTVAPTAVPATAAPVAPTAPPATAYQRVVVTGAGADGVNMRAEPSTTAARVKGLKDGAALETVGADRQADGRTWRNVKDADGAVGWVAADFLAAAGAPQIAPAPAEKPAAAPATTAPVAKPAAPTAAPANAGTIICADGSTWPSPVRQGACSGRGGIRR